VPHQFLIVHDKNSRRYHSVASGQGEVDGRDRVLPEDKVISSLCLYNRRTPYGVAADRLMSILHSGYEMGYSFGVSPIGSAVLATPPNGFELFEPELFSRHKECSLNKFPACLC
jgi:hypothetical protein